MDDLVHNLVCRSFFHGFGPVVPMKGTRKAKAYNDRFDSSTLATVWQQFVFVPFLFQQDNVPAPVKC